jgi:hypothetical protein
MKNRRYGKWRREHEILIGTSARDIVEKSKVTIEEEVMFKP